MKYTNAKYPEKINDLIDNEGNVNPEIIPPAPTPEPGLKLYKHEYEIDGEYIYWINTEKEPAVITDAYSFQDAIKDALQIYKGLSVIISSETQGPTAITFYCMVTEQGSLKFGSFTITDFSFEDIVTELKN